MSAVLNFTPGFSTVRGQGPIFLFELMSNIEINNLFKLLALN